MAFLQQRENMKEQSACACAIIKYTLSETLQSDSSLVPDRAV